MSKYFMIKYCLLKNDINNIYIKERRKLNNIKVFNY